MTGCIIGPAQLPAGPHAARPIRRHPHLQRVAELRQLHAELTATLEAWGRPYEIVAVDDGSPDDSFEILSELHATDPRLRVIRFRRNFGQTAAFAAGFAHARGAIIVTSDGDLQNDPRDIRPWSPSSTRAPTSSAAGADRKDAWLTRRSRRCSPTG